MPFQSSTQCKYQFNDLDRYSFQTMVALALVSLSLSAVSAARFQLDDLAGETLPLSHILTYLNESNGAKPRIDLETVVALWCSLDSKGLADGETAAVFRDKNLRLDILQGTHTSETMFSLDHHQQIWDPEERFQVEKYDFELHSPYLQQLPAVNKAFYEECKRVLKNSLFENVDPDQGVISCDPSYLLFRGSTIAPLSANAKECAVEVVGEMLEKFDWSKELSFRVTFDSENRAVASDVCAGHSYFSLMSQLCPSLPFNPHLRTRQCVCQVVLHGKNAYRDIAEPDEYSNFVTLELSHANNGGYSAPAYTLVHDYPCRLDGVRRGDYFRSDDDDGLFRPAPRSLTSHLSGCYLNQPYLMTNPPGTNLHIDEGGVAQEDVIELVREYNRNFMRIWTEQKEGTRDHLSRY